MDTQVDRLVTKTWEKFQKLDASHRLLIAVGGIPGSGKTTFTTTIVSRLNTLHHTRFHTLHPNAATTDATHPDPSQPDIATYIPLDGYHLTRQQLSQLPNAEEAIFRRGAPFTFDAQSYLQLVEQLRTPLEATTSTIHAPSFDHAIANPVENDIPIPPTARIILLEGIYVAFNQPPWSNAAKLMDELWFVDVDVDVAVSRVVKRHVASGISPDVEHAERRVRESDMRNGREILENRMEVDEVVVSVEVEEWKSRDLKAAEGEDGRQRPVSGAGGRKDSLLELAESGGGL